MAMTTLEACESVVEEMKATQDILLEALQESKQWHQGDKWRDDPDEANRDAWQIQMNRIDAAIAKATNA